METDVIAERLDNLKHSLDEHRTENRETNLRRPSDNRYNFGLVGQVVF